MKSRWLSLFLIGTPLLIAAPSLAMPQAELADQQLGSPPLVGPPAPVPQLDYKAHLAALRPLLAQLPGRYAVEVEPPFVVVGNSGKRDVRKLAQGLIRWSVGELKQRYFSKDPDEIITIYLFKDRASYLAGAYLLTGSYPDTPFGFYTPQQQALIMNIATGGGTLVHELVHPLMAANFPACPPWFNEGMGSLYEAVGRRDHRIWGYLNWRLPGLQRAIRAGALPTFTELLAMDEEHFYNEQAGVHYAQARYLLYYLQERGLLKTYYHAFIANQRRDPSGRLTLQRILGQDDLAAFQRRWSRYVLKLRYQNPPVK